MRLSIKKNFVPLFLLAGWEITQPTFTCQHMSMNVPLMKEFQELLYRLQCILFSEKNVKKSDPITCSQEANQAPIQHFFPIFPILIDSISRWFEIENKFLIWSQYIFPNCHVIACCDGDSAISLLVCLKLFFHLMCNFFHLMCNFFYLICNFFYLICNFFPNV